MSDEVQTSSPPIGGERAGTAAVKWNKLHPAAEGGTPTFSTCVLGQTWTLARHDGAEGRTAMWRLKAGSGFDGAWRDLTDGTASVETAQSLALVHIGVQVDKGFQAGAEIPAGYLIARWAPHEIRWVVEVKHRTEAAVAEELFAVETDGGPEELGNYRVVALNAAESAALDGAEHVLIDMSRGTDAPQWLTEYGERLAARGEALDPPWVLQVPGEPLPWPVVGMARVLGRADHYIAMVQRPGLAERAFATLLLTPDGQGGWKVREGEYDLTVAEAWRSCLERSGRTEARERGEEAAQ